jgi:hypothetical protein
LGQESSAKETLINHKLNSDFGGRPSFIFAILQIKGWKFLDFRKDGCMSSRLKAENTALALENVLLFFNKAFFKL